MTHFFALDGIAPLLVLPLLEAIAAEDAASVAPLLEPQGPLACAYDLWGFAALHLLIDWAEAVRHPVIAVTGEGADRALALVSWGEAGHGATLELRQRASGWQAYAARPRAHPDAPLNPAFALTETAGVRLPFQMPSKDPVEQLLRERGVDRLLGLTAIAERVLLWRLSAASLQLPALKPATWAAAMEYQLLRHGDLERAAALATSCYGASRRDLERATFLLEAGWRLRAT